MLHNPIKGVLLELNSVITETATKIILQADFSLSEKLHLETGLAFNTTLFLADLLQRKQFRLGLYLWEVWSPRQDSPIDLLKTTIYASISKGFSTPTVSETLTPDGEINSLKPEIGGTMNWG
jgi:iron complex outermembrane receptor protein